MPSDEINATADEVFSTIDLDGDKKVSFLEFKHWYMKSETRVMNDVKTAFDKIDVTEDGFVEQSKFTTVVEAMGMKEYMTAKNTVPSVFWDAFVLLIWGAASAGLTVLFIEEKIPPEPYRIALVVLMALAIRL